MRDLEPTLTAGLFRELSDELVSLLRSLDASDWQDAALGRAFVTTRAVMVADERGL